MPLLLIAGERLDFFDQSKQYRRLYVETDVECSHVEQSIDPHLAIYSSFQGRRFLPCVFYSSSSCYRLGSRIISMAKHTFPELDLYLYAHFLVGAGYGQHDLQ